MSFATDLKTLMNADATLNGLVDGIYFLEGPDNVDLTSEYIVYNYEKIDDISSLDAYNTMIIYKLEIIPYSDDSLVLDNIGEAIRAYLDNYNTTPFEDCHYVDDERGTMGEKNQYLSPLEYRIIYRN